MTFEKYNNSFQFTGTQRKTLTEILEKEMSRAVSGSAVSSLEHSILQYTKDIKGCTSPPALHVLTGMLNDLDRFNFEFHARLDKYRALAETYYPVKVDWRYNDLDAVPSDNTLFTIGINDSDLEVAGLIVEQIKEILERSVSAGDNVADKSLRILCGSIADALSQASGKPKRTVREMGWFRQVLAIVLDAVDVQVCPDTIYLAANSRPQLEKTSG
jgi:hypothetical protein